MEKEVMFTNEQVEAIKEILEEELGKLKKEIDKDYIHRVIIEKMLDTTKKEKLKNTDIGSGMFIDGMIYAFEEVLKKE